MDFRYWGQIREVQIGNFNYTFEDLDIDFSVNFGADSKSDVSEVTIYNIKKEVYDSIKQDALIYIKAGWKESYGTILSGVVEKKEQKIQGSDIATVIKCSESSAKWNNHQCNITWKRGICASDVAKDLINRSTFSVGVINPKLDVRYTNGYKALGTIKRTLEKIALDTKSVIKFYNGAVYLMPSDGTIKRTIYLDSTKEPYQLEESETDKKTKQRKWKLVCNLRFDMKPDVVVNCDGVSYQIVKGTHNASDLDFTTECELIEVKK